MHRPVERFSVNLRDPIGETRAGVGLPSRSGPHPFLLLLPVALVLGMTLALLLGLDRPPARTVPLAAERPDAAGLGEIEPAAGGDAMDWFGDFLPAVLSGSRSGGRSTGWPVILHRAGDGAFYADIMAGGNAAHLRVDPTGTASRLAEEDLPRGTVLKAGNWSGVEVELQHLRLPAVTFEIVEKPAEAVLGIAGLEPALDVEETLQRLRLTRAGR